MSAQADIVYLSVGDRIDFEIKEIWDDKITIEPDHAGGFDIDLEDLRSLKTDWPIDIELCNRQEGVFIMAVGINS